MEIKEEKILNKIIYTINAFLSPKRIYLFGSRAKGSNIKGSDFDIAVDREKPPFNTICEIEDKIDEICGLYSVDIVYLDSVDEAFKNIVINSGKIIYEK